MTDATGSSGGIFDRWLATYGTVAALLLLAGSLAGFALGAALPPEAFVEESQKSPFSPFEGDDEVDLTFVSILTNNLIAVTLMTLGAFSLASITVFSLVLNGIVIGFVVNWALRDLTALEVFLLVAPHGILEIPAMLVVGAIGLRFGHRTVRYLRGRTPYLVDERELREGLLLYVLALALIVVAAWIEGNYTLAIAERFAG